MTRLTDHPDYNVWRKMRQRCNAPNSTNYKWYGAKGIKVCARWNSFEAFIKDMGPRPTPQHSIDRLDNSKGYSKKNCKWSTTAEQNRNRTANHFITKNGETKCLSEWARYDGLCESTLRKRLVRGRRLFSEEYQICTNSGETTVYEGCLLLVPGTL